MRDIDFRYFLYARKSSESEDRQMASIEDQIAEVKRIAEKYNLKIVDIISESKSAKEPGRIGFNSMLQRIHKGEAQGILTWKLNRLARNPVDGGQISWMLQQNIIKHIQTFERDYNPSDNVLLMQIEFGMANQYVKDLSLDVKRGMRQKAERGWYPITQLPIGYLHNSRYVLGIDNEIIPNEEQFYILKKLWKLLLTGKYSIADIKRKGDAMGLRNNSNQPFVRGAYHKIFTNEFYCGFYYWRNSNGHLVKFQGKHKVMISPLEFQKVQIILGNKTNFSARVRMYDFPYKGIIKCGECGCTVTQDHKLQAICKKCKYKFSIKNRTTCPRCNSELSEMRSPSIINILYYRCSKSKGKCSQGGIRKEDIDSTIEAELKKISITNEFYSWAIKNLKEKITLQKGKNDKAVTVLMKKKAELENRVTGLVNIRADGEISSDQFNLSIAKNKKELSSIETEIEEAKRLYVEMFDDRKKDLDFALEALNKFKNGDNSIKTEVVKDLSLNLILLNKKLEITTRKPHSLVKMLGLEYKSKNEA